jgi:hypothetical protein
MRKIASLVIVLTLTFGVILAFTTSAGLLMVFAQSNKTTSSSATTNQTNSSSSPRSSPASTVHIAKIKITSPTRGQQVSVGKDLIISGTSIDNATSNDCKVSVIANKVRPYQPATAIGTGGRNDYSKWNFVLTSKYTTIKPGPNRITAKYECVNNPALNSFSSVNVTGVQAATSSSSPSPSATNQTKSSSSPPPQTTNSTVATTASSPSATNQTKSSSSAPPPPPSTVSANQTAAKQQQPANNTGRSSNSTANPLANIPVIGKLFGGK